MHAVLCCCVAQAVLATVSCEDRFLVERVKPNEPSLANYAKREALFLWIRVGLPAGDAEHVFGPAWVKWRAGPTSWWYYEMGAIVRYQPRFPPWPIIPLRVHGGIY